MHPSSRFRLPAVAGACLALLSACGGGSSSPDAALQSPAGGTSLSGTVAVGAPMLNATVTVIDAAGVTRSAAAAADGSYGGLSVDGLTAPFRIQACGLVDGQYSCYYAVVDKAGTANVTPLTHAGVSLALGRDAAAMFEQGGSAPGAAQLAAQKQNLLDALAPVLAAMGLPQDVDFAATAFAADRTGLDKLLDALKITTGTDVGSGNQAAAFVQVEGKIGGGNVLLGRDGASGAGLAGGAGLDVDLRSISTVFRSMSAALGAASEAACTSGMAGAALFDAAFSLQVDEGSPIDAQTAPAAICHMASLGGLLGGQFANPVIRECDFSGSDKICTVGFEIVKEDVVFDGAELAVVLRSGAPAWKLLGRDSPYEIHVGAAVQRTLRVDVADAAPSYARALSFDIGTGGGSVHAAKVYQRDAAGTGWDLSPIAVLDDAGCGGLPRLTYQGSACGSNWMSLDAYGASAAEGDALIDAFYRRGRQVRIDLFSDLATTQRVASIVKRIDGVPPKAAALPAVPWLELDAASRAALAAYAGASPQFTATWAGNAAVSAKDISFCLSSGCAGDARAAHDEVSSARRGATSRTMTLSAVPPNASAYKQVALYGRNREQMGVSSNYVSCGGAPSCP